MNTLTSVTFAAAAVLLASAPAAAGETTAETGFAAVARLPVTALSTSEMAETRGTNGITAYLDLSQVYGAESSRPQGIDLGASNIAR